MERTGFEQWKPREVARLLSLVETERRYYQEIMTALPAALVVLASDRTILSANVAFRRLVGLSGEELRRRTIEQILPSDELIERLRAAHVQGDTGPFSISTPFSINMGERRFRMAAAPIRGWEDEMEPETLLLVQPEEEAAPAAVAPRLPTKPTPEPTIDLAALPCAVWQADASTLAFTSVGGAAEEILGYPSAHWLAEPQFFSERIHPEDREGVMALYRSIAAAGGEVSAEFRGVLASGGTVWCRERVRVPGPKEGAGEGARHITGVLNPMGERRRLEAQSIAGARVHALRSLAGRLAHDLNNPLMIVTGYSEELLHALPEGDPLRGDLNEVLAASKRLTDVAARLLAYTRSPAKAPSKLELSSVIAGLDIGGFGVDVEIAAPDGAVWSFADAGQLEEALGALAAFAFENTRGVSRLRVICRAASIVELAWRATLQPGAYARIDIQAEGQGAGAPEGVFESILPPKDADERVSLALARAYINVHQWGGDIAFSSTAEYGSAFEIYLPYAEPPHVEPPAETDEEAAAMETAEIAAPEPQPEPLVEPPLVEPMLGTVLVVEDEPGIRGLVRKILKRERYEVLEAGSGEEAMAAASAHAGSIGLLLTDVMLPGMGGRELAEALLTTRADLKVVYISGFTDDESVRAGQFPPGSLFLQKPFTLNALVGVVKQALETNAG